MNKYFLLIISNLFFLQIVVAQDSNCLQLKYEKTVIKDLDSIKDVNTVWLYKHFAYEFNSDASQNSLYDFDKESHVIHYMGREHVLITDVSDRKHDYKILPIDNKNNFNANFKIALPAISTITPFGTSETTDTIYFDSSVYIPKSNNKGFVDRLDNGFGYLPVYFERTVLDNDKTTKSIFKLVSQDSIFIEPKRIAEVFK